MLQVNFVEKDPPRKAEKAPVCEPRPRAGAGGRLGQSRCSHGVRDGPLSSFGLPACSFPYQVLTGVGVVRIERANTLENPQLFLAHSAFSVNIHVACLCG